MWKLIVAVLTLLLPGPDAAIAQVPEAQEVPTMEPGSISLSYSVVMDVPAGENIRRIASDGAVVTSRWRDGTVTFTLHDPEGGSSTRLPFSPAVPKSEYRSVTEVRVDGPYVSFTDVRDPDFAIYDRRTQEVRRRTHPGGGRVGDLSVSLQTGDVLYGRREGPVTKFRVYLWRRGESEPILISEKDTYTPQWAPSGNFFLLRKQVSAQEAGRGDEESYGWWLYDSNGDPLLDLSRYGRPSQADWSPDSKKIALDVRSNRLGLFILYLEGSGQSIEVKQARYVMPPEDKSFFAPKWSPDGSTLAYIVEHVGDHGGARMELRVLRDGNGTYRRYSAGVGSASTFWARPPWTWTSPTTLHIADVADGESPDSGPSVDLQITKLTIDF